MQEAAKTLLIAGVIGLMVLPGPLFGDDKPPLTSDEILKKDFPAAIRWALEAA